MPSYAIRIVVGTRAVGGSAAGNRAVPYGRNRGTRRSAAHLRVAAALPSVIGGADLRNIYRGPTCDPRPFSQRLGSFRPRLTSSLQLGIKSRFACFNARRPDVVVIKHLFQYFKAPFRLIGFYGDYLKRGLICYRMG